MTTTREAKAAEILKAHRAAARVAKARQLSPAFDAECREADRLAERLDVSQWTVRQHVSYGLGFAFGWLRDRWTRLLLLAGMIWFLVKTAPLLWAGIQFLAYMIPLWFVCWMGRGFRPARPRGYYYRGCYRLW